MSLTATGTIVVIGNTEQITDRFSKREVVLETESGKYPQTVMFQATGKGCELLDSVNVGDEVNVSFNLRGRRWNSPKGEVKYFNTLNLWAIDILNKGQASSQVDDLQDEDIPF